MNEIPFDLAVAKCCAICDNSSRIEDGTPYDLYCDYHDINVRCYMTCESYFVDEDEDDED